MRRAQRKLWYRNELLLKAHADMKPRVAVLCRSLGIARSTYYDVLNGGPNVSLHMLDYVSNALGLKLADVFTLGEQDLPTQPLKNLPENVGNSATYPLTSVGK